MKNKKNKKTSLSSGISTDNQKHTQPEITSQNRIEFDKESQPTIKMYGFLQRAYDFFNKELFNDELTGVMMNLQREKNIAGFFSFERWIDKDGNYTHEISLNPVYFHTTPLEFFQTLVHEMCHQWQNEQGKPSPNGYHNKEWSNKMESLGLIPYNIDNKDIKTGYKIADFPQINGLFAKSCFRFASNGFQISYFDVERVMPNENAQTTESPEQIQSALIVTESVAHEIVSSLLPSLTDDETNEEAEHLSQQIMNALVSNDLTEALEVHHQKNDELTNLRKKNKRKSVFKCPICGDQAWGKPSLQLRCDKETCDARMLKIED